MHLHYVAKLSRDELERRRLLAAADLRGGMYQAEVARKYGVSRASVSRWTAALEDDGEEGLKRTFSPGFPSKLSDDQWQQLEEMLLKGPREFGYSSEVWTGKRVARLVREKFGARYNPNYLIDVLHTRFNMTWQRPRRVAHERDEAKRAGWIKTVWEPPKKNSAEASAPSPSSTSRGSPRRRSSARPGRRGARRPSSTTSRAPGSE